MIGIKFKINIKRKKINKGEKFQINSLIFDKNLIFLVNNFRASEIGWNIPIILNLFGPNRKCRHPKIFRSRIVKNAIDTNIKIIIIIKFNKI